MCYNLLDIPAQTAVASIGIMYISFGAAEQAVAQPRQAAQIK